MVPGRGANQPFYRGEVGATIGKTRRSEGGS